MADTSDTDTRIQHCLDQLQGTGARDRRNIRNELATLILPWARERAFSILHGGFPRLYRDEKTDDLLGWGVLRLLKVIDAGLSPKTISDLKKLIEQFLWLKALDLVKKHFGKSGSNRPKRLGQAKDADNSPEQVVPEKITSSTAMERWSLLHSFAKELPEMQRKAFELHFYHGKTMAEIGSEQGISEEAAKKRWQKAFTLLSSKAKKYLQKAMPGDDGSSSRSRRRPQSGSGKSRRGTQSQGKRPRGTSSMFKKGMHVEGCSLIACLGSGAFGEVWKATTPDGQPIAIKFVPDSRPRLTADQEALFEKQGYVEVEGDKHEKEFQGWENMMAIRHPNLIKVFGFELFRGYMAFATELADHSLRDVMTAATNAGKTLDLPHAISIVRQAARGLDYLHRCQLDHLDIKPSNLLFVGHTLKIGDYTLVVPHEYPAFMAGPFMSTPYAAPERLRGESSRSMDQYSLACVYYEMRAGRVPFAEKPEERVMQNADLSTFAKAEQRVLAKALHRDPSKRWPDCRTFALKLAKSHEDELPPEMLAPFTSDPNVVWENWYLRAVLGEREVSPWKDFLRNKPPWTIPPMPEWFVVDESMEDYYGES